ncbi:MAG: spore germination protein [Clostridia bacterium]|nr:spore germination protein [Clostridia bacterium]
MNIDELTERIKSTFFFTDDLICRPIKLADKDALIVFLDGGVDKSLLDRDVISPLSRIEKFDDTIENVLRANTFYAEDIKVVPTKDCPKNVASGDVVLAVNGDENAYVYSLRSPEKRAPSEPPTESVMKGPREGFIEDVKTNLSLVRRRIKSPALTVKMLTVGRYSSTSVAVVYMSGIADEKIVGEIISKIKAIDIDGVIDSAYVLAYLRPKKHSFFLQAGSTEKPDVASAKLLEGRIAIVVDGSPIVITLPYLIFEDVQDGYDYYSEDWRASMIRLFRLLGAMLTMILPGAYVALQTYHFQLLPLKFLTTLLSATNGIPFPPAIEMLIVLALFEILNQASIRMPRYFGISLSVVGAIVLGDTAVKSGLISSPSVLVIALSAIGIFCVPDQVGVMSILRLMFLLVSAVLGFVGIVILLILTVGYLAGLDNYGTPYLAPYAPRVNPDLKDGFLKVATTDMDERPYSIPTANRVRNKKP